MPGHLCRQLGVQLLHLVMIRIARIPTFTLFTVLFSTFFQPWLGCMEAAMLGNPKCIFAKCTRLACLLSFPSFFQSRYPVPDQVEMGNDHGNCWLLRHCNSWEVSNHICRRKKEEKLFVQLRFAKPVSRGLLAEPMWTIACENSFLDPLVELDITCSFTLSFPVDYGWSLSHNSK